MQETNVYAYVEIALTSVQKLEPRHLDEIRWSVENALKLYDDEHGICTRGYIKNVFVKVSLDEE
jgi:hypothetical protein